METTKTPTEKIIDGLRKAAIELEKFQVQAALGKAEAKDKYEAAKKEFQKYIHEARVRIDETKSSAESKYKDLKPLLESLQVQFALGKAETKKTLDEKRKQFTKALSELETYFRIK